MKAVFRPFMTALIAAIFVGISGCATLNPIDLLTGANTVQKVPVVRQILQDYLTPDELASIDGELALWDSLTSKAETIIAGDADISAVEALAKLFGAPEKIKEIEDAHVKIKAVVRQHAADNPNEPVPAELTVFNTDAEGLYKRLKAAILANDRTVKAIELMKLLRPLAIALL